MKSDIANVLGLLNDINLAGEIEYSAYNELFEAVSGLPLNVDEVIRCKDCVYLGFKDFRGICTGAVCHTITPEDFCSFAKRRVE